MLDASIDADAPRYLCFSTRERHYAIEASLGRDWALSRCDSEKAIVVFGVADLRRFMMLSEPNWVSFDYQKGAMKPPYKDSIGVFSDPKAFAVDRQSRVSAL